MIDFQIRNHSQSSILRPFHSLPITIFENRSIVDVFLIWKSIILRLLKQSSEHLEWLTKPPPVFRKPFWVGCRNTGNGLQKKSCRNIWGGFQRKFQCSDNMKMANENGCRNTWNGLQRQTQNRKKYNNARFLFFTGVKICPLWEPLFWRAHPNIMD